MSLTPIEEGEDGRDDTGTGPDRQSGVWALLGAVLFALDQSWREFLRWLHSPSEQSAADSDRESQLQVSGQRRLVSGTDDSTRQNELAMLPEQTEVKSEEDGDSLRVYDPERDEAYISSDTWETVDR